MRTEGVAAMSERSKGIPGGKSRAERQTRTVRNGILASFQQANNYPYSLRQLEQYQGFIHIRI